jgi:signal peptidase II
MVGMGLLVVVVDQLTKYWILGYFVTQGHTQPIPLLGPYLELWFIPNTGVAFSLLEGQTIKFLLIGLAIAAIAYLYWRSRETGTLLLKVAFGLVLGGAVGNLLDRFTRQYVVDFIHFQIPQIGFSFAVFNMADSAITLGVLLLAYLLWRGGANEPAAEKPASPTGAASSATSNLNGRHGGAVDGSVSDSAPGRSMARTAPRVRRKLTDNG